MNGEIMYTVEVFLLIFGQSNLLQEIFTKIQLNIEIVERILSKEWFRCSVGSFVSSLVCAICKSKRLYEPFFYAQFLNFFVLVTSSQDVGGR